MKNLVLVLLFTSLNAFAIDCPVSFESSTDYQSDVADKVAAASTCFEAAEIAEACAMGSRMDGIFVAPAIEKCSRRFKKVGPKVAAAIKTAKTICAKKFSPEQGSMYASMEGFCMLNVAKLFDSLLEPVEN